MDEFLEVIRGIDWNLLHEQKRELLKIVSIQEEMIGTKTKIMGLVHLIDSLQDTASKLKIWEFPGMYDGECPECGKRNYEHLENEKYKCYDCGEIFSITVHGHDIHKES